jgi:hypothetical protein
MKIKYRQLTSSSSAGRTIVIQSLSLKKLHINSRMRFFETIDSVNPCWGLKQFSRYWELLIFVPFSSTNFNVKSLTIHKKEGKNSASELPSEFLSEDLAWMTWVRFVTNERSSIACPSITLFEYFIYIYFQLFGVITYIYIYQLLYYTLTPENYIRKMKITEELGQIF